MDIFRVVSYRMGWGISWYLAPSVLTHKFTKVHAYTHALVTSNIILKKDLIWGIHLVRIK